ncbi:MAG: RIP metalloprotease RseP [Candidatus Binatia bacterium]|jgi:regulator of sigma E protease
MSIVVAAIVLGFLILFHELGHFLVAKRTGVGVLKFSIGFGPKVIGKRVGRTEYVLSAVPLGGFVKMVGEDPDEEVTAEDQKVAFQHQSLWKRMAIVAAGPGANILFAFVAFSLVFAIYGARVPSEAAKVGGVIENMPAAQAGLKIGDLITSVNGTPVDKWDKLSETIRASGGNSVTLTVQREGATVQIEVTPQAKPDKNIFGETLGTAYVIGIERGSDEEQVGPLTAVGMGAKQTAWWVETLLISIAKIFQGRIPAKDIGGPILIVQAAGQQARLGLEYLLHFMAVISINLGVLNLLPIPVLDGGHFLFFAAEAVLRRPLDIRHREIAQQVGLVLLISLMAFAFYNDIARVVQGWG